MKKRNLMQWVKTFEYIDLLTRNKLALSDIESSSDIIFSVYGEPIYSDKLAKAPAEFELADDSAAYKQAPLDRSKWQLKQSQGYYAQESAEVIIFQRLD